MYTCTLQTLKFMSDCVCVCGWVYLSLYMARIYGCGVVNVAVYLVSVCEMHFMNLLWLLMWRHLHRATHSHPHTHAHTRTGSGRHLALTLCGTGVTQSTPTSGLAGVRLDGRCHKRDKERGAGGGAVRGMRAKGAHLYLYCRIAGCAICSRASSVYHPGLILAGHGFH